MHGGVGESGEEEYYKGRVWSAGGWTSVTSTHGMAATTGVATNTERSLSLPYYLPHKAIHHNTDCHGQCAQEHQYGHSARAVQEKEGNGFGIVGIPTPVTTWYSQITHIHARYKCQFVCLDVITPTLCKEIANEYNSQERTTKE